MSLLIKGTRTDFALVIPLSLKWLAMTTIMFIRLRFFLKNPPILILDEATSALDNESEYLIQQSLEKLAKGRTTFTVAHRLTTIKNADRILVLTENGIEESGTHKELIEKGGLYADLYKMYSFTE